MVYARHGVALQPLRAHGNAAAITAAATVVRRSGAIDGSGPVYAGRNTLVAPRVGGPQGPLAAQKGRAGVKHHPKPHQRPAHASGRWQHTNSMRGNPGPR